MIITRQQTWTNRAQGWCMQCGKGGMLRVHGRVGPGVVWDKCTECGMHFLFNFLEDAEDTFEVEDGWVLPPSKATSKED